jgi:hypothetical protein
VNDRVLCVLLSTTYSFSSSVTAACKSKGNALACTVGCRLVFRVSVLPGLFGVVYTYVMIFPVEKSPKLIFH